MRTINLLPWREEQRRERQRNFLILLLLAGLAAAACVFLVHRYYDARIENQNERNAFLRTEIQALDRKIARIEQLEETRQSLLNRKRVIENLQANRTLMVRLFDQLVRTTPTGIRLLNVRQRADELTITGTSQSQARVSTYMRNIESSPVLHEPRLRIIEQGTDGTDAQMPYGFTVVAKVQAPEATEDYEAESGGEAVSQ